MKAIDTKLDPEYVRFLFDLTIDGKLIWRQRDESYFNSVKSHRMWTAKFAGKVAGNITPDGYIRVGIQVNNKSKLYLAHRLVWVIVNGAWPENEIDHINGIRSDNRPENLREATRSQQSQNAKYKGVTKLHYGKWQARIGIDGKMHSLGIFDTEEEARRAYLDGKEKLHPFRRLA